MSRGYSKIHSRKLNAASQSSIQFDKLLNENSNRPCASKSSGTLGKWGVISCTSIRSTNVKSRRDEPLGSKRKRADLNKAAKPVAPPEDPFSFDTEPGGAGSKGRQAAASPVKPAVIKPKKFFKSRNAEAAPSADIATNLPVFSEANQTGTAMYSGKKPPKDSHVADSAAVSKKFFTSKKTVEPVVSEQTEAMNLSSPNKSPSPSKAEHKPPIVLRIFKGTSHLVNETEKKSAPAVVPKPPVSTEANVATVRTTRSGRTTRNYSELDDEDDDFAPLSVVAEPRRSRSTSLTRSSSIKESPKRTRRTKTPVMPQASSKSPLKSSLYIDSNKSVEEEEEEEEREVDEENEDTHQDDELNVSTADTIPFTSEDTGFESLSSSFTSASCSQNENNETITPSIDVPPDPDVTLKLKEDEEKLLKAEELLASTYVDFNSASEKLLQPKEKIASESSVPTKPEWYSDSDESNCGNDHLATLPSSADDLNSCKVDLETKLDSDVSADASMERTNSPARKKGSIFKSRSLLAGGSNKRLALYKHKWSDNDKTGNNSAASTQAAPSQPPSVLAELDEEAKLTRVTSWPMTDVDDLQLEDAEAITSVKCTKKAKGFYTVVRNVQKAHQIQESGEFQEFNDDVEYILDTLQDTAPMGTRCLSAIRLASKCMAPAFRMHVRAHGTVAKFFRALHDATKDQSLGLCTATVMFVLSQDRLNMDLDRHSLELMLNLLESDVSHRHALDACGLTDKQLHKNKQKVRELCEEIQSQGHAKHLNLDNITVGHLAMETLLSLTSRRAGEWFKEELRELGGLEHIVKTICECCRQVDDYVVEWTDPLLDKLRKVDRCLRVLENVTYQNEENQLYLLRYGDGVLLDTLVKLFRQCDAEMPLYPVTDPADKDSTGTVIREVLLTTLKVLINLTHDFNNKSYGSALAGERKGIIDSSLHLLLQAPDYVPDEKKFDMLVLALILLINLVEHCQPNRKLLFEAKAPTEPGSVFNSCDKTAVQALIDLFHQQEEHARNEEMKTDAILDGKKDTEQPEEVVEKPKTQEEFIEETVAKLLQKAGRHMEHTLISAYVGLLLGYLVMDNPTFEVYVRHCFPDKTFATMIAVLQKVYNFMNLTASAVGSSRGIAQTERVINFMTKSDKLATSALEAGPSRSDEELHVNRFS